MLNVNKMIQLIAMISFLSVTSVKVAYADADIVKNKSSFTNNSGDFTNSVKLGTGVSERKAVRPDFLQVMQGNTPETQYLNLPINKAAIIRLPRPSRDVVVANPLLMDVVVRSPQELYLFAKYAGHTNAFIFDDMGKQIVNLEINIGIDTKELERVFKEQIPESNIKITSMADTIILSGNVKNASYAKIARDIAQRLVDSPEKIINNIGVTGQEQVMIKVKVAEMQRTILKQLGIDWNTAFQVGKVAGGFGLQNGFGANGTPATGLVGSGYNTSNILSSAVGGLPAFSTQGAVQTYLSGLAASIAQQTSVIEEGRARITAIQDASVVPDATTGIAPGITGPQQVLINQIQNDISRAGSEIARANAETLKINGQLTNAASITEGEPALRARTAGFQSENISVDNLIKALERHSLLKTLAEPNLTALSGESAKFLAGGELPYLVSQTFGQASVDFKPYGIGLAFTPVVLNEDRISLKVSTEISEISETVTAGNSSYPGLSVRRAETTVEMPSGGTMAMAGLIRDDTRRAVDSTPGLKEVPVLGALFRSNDFKSSQSELVVLVTPYLAKPAHESDFGLPTDGYSNPSDMDMYLRGHLAAVYDDEESENYKKENADSILGNLLSNDKEESNNSNSDEHILE